jgi:hypothetical protein
VSVPVNAIAPRRSTVTSTKKLDEGVTAPRLSFRAAPSTGWIHNDTRVPSLAPTSSDVPSAIQIARAMLRSIGRVMLRPAPPPRAAATWTSLPLPGSKSRGCA